MKEGDRIRLDYTDDEWTRLVPGSLGTVTYVDPTGTVFAKWDDGSSLGLVPGVDQWTVVNA